MRIEIAHPTIVEFNYTNHRGEHRGRRAITRAVRWGTSDYYPGSPPQWYLEADDIEKNDRREFRMLAMSHVR